MAGFGIDRDLAVVDVEDGNVDGVDEVAGGAAGYRRHAGIGEGAAADHRAGRPVDVLDDLGDGHARSGLASISTRPLPSTRFSAEV